MYTGPFNPQPTPVAEEAEPLDGEVMVVWATYGHPRYRFPPRQEVWPDVHEFVARSSRDDAVPVLLAHSLSTALEAVQVLLAAGHSVRAHGSIRSYCQRARGLGLELGCPKPFGLGPRSDEVLVFPEHLRRLPALTAIRRKRLALLSGRVVEPGLVQRLGLDAGFPISAHADHPSLLRHIRQSGAREIYPVHGHAAALARELRDLGLAAQALLPPEQLALL